MKKLLSNPYVQLLKPVTWFPPMWAFACGVVSSGLPNIADHWYLIPLGILLAGPLVCGNSQIINDWFDRHVDAINEPQRPIPSGRVPGRRALWYAIAVSLLSLGVAWLLGTWVFWATVFGLAMAWGYSMPPFRFKGNGWWGNSAVALCYEGLPWFTGAAVMLGGAFPDWRIVAVLLLYSAGAHGIMTLNDFKALEGDRQMNVRSLPVQMGPERAAKFACLVMALPQVVVILLLLKWDALFQGGLVTASLLAQFWCMSVMLKDPKGKAPWYNMTGVTLYVLGMMVSATALAGLASVGAP
ncbi:chlorophyll synthase ChlG [Phaeovibrio sulfidiphilus]|uniref:Chlorophyll synthase ChlG n=1 Tax=Phaeovibrio sulfidiphilus TaxID=1220600 RepID=A0A8J6YNR1_9PROT|nr:chlorophyll synthase ChlG [Phaeovibrio sulfidiphilus]MBE1236322.1 chlorophyll synthase ChlG [Phaeovibrio sulfidiphilus]